MAEPPPEGTQGEEGSTESEESETSQKEIIEDVEYAKPSKCCGFTCAKYIDFEENGHGKNPTTYGYIYNFFLHWRTITVILTPSILLSLLLVENSLQMLQVIIMTTMAVYWLTLAIPLPMVALIPVVFFPLLSIEGTQESSIQYIKQASMLLVGAIILYQAVEVCHLHERICLKIILLIGTSPKQLMLGVMLSTMFTSMWIPNLAATTVTVPLVEAITQELKKKERDAVRKSIIESMNEGKPEDAAIDTTPEAVNKEGVSENILLSENEEYIKKYMSTLQVNIDDQSILPSQETIGLYLAVAYASSIGGTGTLIGANANIVLYGIIEMIFPEVKGLNFGSWMLFSIPNMLVCTLLGWFMLQLLYMKLFRGAARKASKSKDIHKIVIQKYERLGNMTFHEYVISIIFIVGLVFLLSRSSNFYDGWAAGYKEIAVKDATPAIVIVIVLHILPANTDFMRCNSDGGDHKVSPNLIGWKHIQEKMPWGLLLLIGGGFCITHGIMVTGLSLTLVDKFDDLSDIQPLPLLFLTCIIATTFSQVASTVATANILLPLIAFLCIATKTHPFYLLIPTAICCSFPFMLPGGNPSNAIVYLASNMKKSNMVKSGLIMCIISITVTIISINTLGLAIFDLKTYPEWGVLSK